MIIITKILGNYKSLHLLEIYFSLHWTFGSELRMKIFVIFSVLLAVTCASVVPTSEVTLEEVKSIENVSTRINQGQAAKKGENLDLCILQITFIEKSVCKFILHMKFI